MTKNRTNIGPNRPSRRTVQNSDFLLLLAPVLFFDPDVDFESFNSYWKTGVIAGEHGRGYYTWTNGCTDCRVHGVPISSEFILAIF